MKWNLLITRRRQSGRQDDPGESRTPFERDYDRIIFTGSFRRLADKTQVFPIPTDDHIHSRLTHSLEAASIGHSLGRLAGATLQGSGLLPSGFGPDDVSDAVAAACLAHDLGNPPFGHVGEDAIKEFFREEQERKSGWFKDMPAAVQADLLGFEGNAQAFALVVRAEQASDSDGLDLCLPTLGALVKYPCSSLDVDERKGVHRKKFGYFSQDAATMGGIAVGLGLDLEGDSRSAWVRHPLAYLTEAADDIAYRLLDFEDGLRLGLVAPESFGERIIAVLRDPPPAGLSKMKSLTRQEMLRAAGHGRALAIEAVVGEAASVFVNDLATIASGKRKVSLLDDIPSGDALKEIEKLNTQCCYRSRDVLKMEIAGTAAIKGVLGRLISATVGERDLTSNRLRKMLPELLTSAAPPHQRVLGVTEHVCGMTDTYVLRLFRELTGIRLPGDRS